MHDATAIFLDPNSAAAFSIRGCCRQSIGDEEGAAADQEEMFRIDPTRPPVYVPGSDKIEASPTTDLERSVAGQAARRTQPDAYKDLFADGNPVDRSLNARKPVGEVAEKLAELSGYRPETITRPLSRGRAERIGRGLSPRLLAILFTAAVLILVGIILASRPTKSVRPVAVHDGEGPRAEEPKTGDTQGASERAVVVPAMSVPADWIDLLPQS